jgi:CHAD domain-containing protein
VADVADQPASDVLAKMVRRSSRKLVRRVEAAASTDGAEREHALHQVRKAAKQARYAGEAVEPAFGSKAARLTKQAKQIQEILGEHQDSVVGAEVLRGLGIAAHGSADESSFTFGLLAGLERAYGADARRRFDEIWSKSLAKNMRRPLG